MWQLQVFSSVKQTFTELVLRLSLIGGFLLMTTVLSGQLTNLKDTICVFDQAGIVLGGPTPISSTIRISELPKGTAVDPQNFRLTGSRITWDSIYLREASLSAPDSVRIRYRTVPEFLEISYSLYDSSQIDFQEEDIVVGGRLDLFETDRNRALIDFPRLDYGGSFSRGFSVGSNQSLVLNSALNLQLQGDLGDGIGIAAAISDNNIPIQPEGNTRQIQEFDKVFIRLNKAAHTLVAGDFELPRPEGYFINYFKKLKGLNYLHNGRLGKGNLNMNASAAIAKGKFARNMITPIEGNQGPYKLRGTNNERFIIVLSGTERVYVDGELLVRGLEEDYIIDYNMGEISFSRKKLITKDSRIIVEFEYAEQNYNRTHTTLNGLYTGEKFNVYFNLYNEQDSKNVSGDLDLSTEDKLILRESGDMLQDAFAATVRMPEDGFSTNRVMYTMIDTTVEGVIYQDILVYSTIPEEALFTANFSEVGMGNGNYILLESAATNGRVYQWVAPDPATGQPKGNYAPIARLIAPESRQMVSFGGDYAFNEDFGYSGELALSSLDLNRFSPLDDGNNTGIAFTNSLKKRFQVRESWTLAFDGRYEFVQANFRALNPFRNAEFNRDWNLGITERLVREHLPGASVTLERQDWGYLRYQYAGLYRGDLYNGTRNGLELQLAHAGWKMLVAGNFLDAQTDTLSSSFFRPNLALSKVLPGLGDLEAGVSYSREENRRKPLSTGVLSDESFLFDIYRAYLKNGEGRPFHWNLLWESRKDEAAFGDRFVDLTTGQKFNFLGSWQLSENKIIHWDFTYRELRIDREDLTDLNRSNTLLGKLDYQGSHLKNALRLASNYELGTGQEPRVEYRYVEVQPGAGDFIWIDDGDGVEELNEFEIAPFPDEANYIRLNAQNDAFVRTQSVTVNQSVRLNLQPLLHGKPSFAGFLARFSALSSIKYNRKTLEDDGARFWNPFYRNFTDTAVVSLHRQWRNILYFNQSSPHYDIQLGQTLLTQRIHQTIGQEKRGSEEYYLRFRWNFAQSFSLVLQSTRGEKTQESERFTNRDYRIVSETYTPELTYLLSRNVRVIGKYIYSDQRNQLAGDENASIHDFDLESTYRKSEKLSLRSGLSFAKVNFSGEENTPVEFAMLQGLKPGGNILWNLQVDVQFSKSILFTLRYDGRKTGDNPVVHTGNAQVRASF